MSDLETIEKLEKELAELQVKVSELRAALKWYDPLGWLAFLTNTLIQTLGYWVLNRIRRRLFR